MHFHVFPALHISHPSSPLTLFLDLTFEFIVAVAAIVFSILDLGPILMFACPLALAVASWLVVAVVVVGGVVVVVVALALAVCLPLVVGVVFVCSVPIIVCTPLRLATLEVALVLCLRLDMMTLSMMVLPLLPVCLMVRCADCLLVWWSSPMTFLMVLLTL